MTAPLADAQRTLAASLVASEEALEPSVLAAIVPGGTLDAAGALGVYRRGYVARLTEQLGETFPSVWRVLGDEDFFQICREYIAAHRSSSYNLSDYGRDFPAFVEGRSPEFLGELAAFEIAVHDLFHAKAHAPVDAATLASLGDLSGVRFRFGAAVRLVATKHAVYDVFRHRNDVEVPDIDFTRSQYVVLYRSGGDVMAREVDAATFVALDALACGATVDDAIDRAVASDGRFGTAEVGRLFETIALAGLVESIEH